MGYATDIAAVETVYLAFSVTMIILSWVILLPVHSIWMSVLTTHGSPIVVVKKNAAAITIPEGLKTPMCPLSLWMEVVNLLSFHLAKQLRAAEHLWPFDGHSQRLLVFI